jgi:hypothetical protein
VSVPAEIPGLGSSTQKIRPNPTFDPMKAGIGPEEYFVLSRIDGALTLREVLLMTGLPIDRAIGMVVKLRTLGAILLPGETPTTAPRPRPPSSSGIPERIRGNTPGATRARTSTGRVRPATSQDSGAMEIQDDPFASLDKGLPGSTRDEIAALSEDNELSDDDRRLILAMARRVGTPDPWTLLGLPADSDKRRVKRVYFKLSKEFHPDRYYGKQLGSFRPRLETIFEAVARAYADLTDAKPKESAKPARKTGEMQSPTEYAAELYERACEAEVHGDPLDAMKHFAAAIRLDPQVRYLRRAARCALTAGQPRTAEEYANKAANLEPNDLSTSRLLAAAFRAQNKLETAEEVLVMALALPSKNDALVMELRRDLAEIRRALGQ